MVDSLIDCRAPHYGLVAASLRAILDATLLYLPLALSGRAPTTPSWLSFIPTERYYAASLILAPVFLILLWLLVGALMHLILRIAGVASDVDRILNVTGMTSLIVGALLIPWDWLWIALGWQNPVMLGVSHLIIDGWGIAIASIGFVRILRVNAWAAIGLNLMSVAVGVPLAAIFVRSPL